MSFKIKCFNNEENKMCIQIDPFNLRTDRHATTELCLLNTSVFGLDYHNYQSSYIYVVVQYVLILACLAIINKLLSTLKLFI